MYPEAQPWHRCRREGESTDQQEADAECKNCAGTGDDQNVEDFSWKENPMSQHRDSDGAAVTVEMNRRLVGSMAT